MVKKTGEGNISGLKVSILVLEQNANIKRGQEEKKKVLSDAVVPSLFCLKDFWVFSRLFFFPRFVLCCHVIIN